MDLKNEVIAAQRSLALGGSVDALEPRLRLRAERLLKAEVEIPVHPEVPRLVNHFLIGSDPEFMLCPTAREPGIQPRLVYSRLNASSCGGLHTDRAFGADGSGRPVELRSHPAKSAVAVVGSLLNTLRWLAASNTQANKCSHWLCGGAPLGEPCGGHIHIEHRYAERSQLKLAEIKALDDVARSLELLGLSPGSKIRRGGTYGCWSDARPQVHGYEYRTFASWLHSIPLAHLVVTLAKLAVKEPTWAQGHTVSAPEEVPQCIENFLRFYRFFDDDAALALRGLRHSLEWTKTCTSWDPGRDNEFLNFRPKWGLWPVSHTELPNVPSTIKPDAQSLIEVVESIRTNTPPAWRLPKPPLEEFELISGVEFPFVNQENSGADRECYGRLVSPKALGIKLHVMRMYNKNSIHLNPQMLVLLTQKELKELKERCMATGIRLLAGNTSRNIVEVGPGDLRRLIRGTLACGLLPFTLRQFANPAFVEKWQERLK